MATRVEKDQDGAKARLNNLFDLTYIRRSFDRSNPQSAIAPYISTGQVAADLGCGPGFYTLALAERVGPTGKVYAVDFDEQFIRALEEKVEQESYSNIEIHATSASDLPCLIL